MRIAVATSILFIFVGATVAQAAPGGDPGSPFGAPPGQLISGHLSIVHGDDFGHEEEDEGDQGGHFHPQGEVPDHILPDMSYWLETDGGEQLLLEFPGFPPQAQPGAYYNVRGERHGQAFHVAEMTEQAAKGGGSTTGGGKPTKTSTSYVGPRDMIVIPFTFAGNPTPLQATTEEIRDRGFINAKSVRTYYEEGSSTTTPGMTFRGKNDGTASDKDGLPGDVTQTFQITGATDKCDYSNWASAARSAATAAGWDLSGYEHIVYLFPQLMKPGTGVDEVSVCTWSGLAQIGGTYSWLNGTIALGTWAHELGHNLTLWHSRTLICSNTTDQVFVATAASCEYDEYGDPFDVMGNSGNQHHYNARNKGHLGWLPSANIATAVSGQTYTLKPIETATTGLQVLQIPRGREYLYVDFRRPFGSYDAYEPTDDVVNGVLIHSGPGLSTATNSYLIDTTIYPTRTVTDLNTGERRVVPDFTDAALNVGQGFVDTVGGIYIETLSVNPDGTVTVLVRTGVTNAAPVVTASAGSTPVVPGLPHQVVSATATDVDKNLGQFRWHFVSCPSTCPALVNAEGSASGGSMTIPGPTYVPADVGTYRLALTVWDTAGASTTIYVDEGSVI
jgi:hypothetical protein